MEAESWDEVEAESSNATTVNEQSETTNTETIVQGNNETSGSKTTLDSETEIVFTQDSDLEESKVDDIDIDDDDDEYNMTTKSADMAIRVVLFTGKKDEFDPWYEKQLARAKVKGFQRVPIEYRRRHT
jgi:hypothetical protein